ncbi:putative membrane protein [Catenibacillus scindens]|uniref:Putative membrane protein n=1 Tax=Catenibacillus scindens TaxID=673271 RepID=A0A7W8HCT3_9FIRM|nr:YibE/F family protein [Catenibacillus scindens]MBB5266008.1 putative membrane protein [Catenibacillus scindens]
MKSMSFLKKKSMLLIIAIGLILTAILIAIPTGYEDALIYQGMERAVGEVVAVDNSAIKSSGVIQSGEQSCTLLIQDGTFKGQEIEGVNFLSGSLEKDKIFKEGDKAFVAISHDNGEIASVIISDHYRLDKEAILLVVFAVLLILVAGKNGFLAIFSFAITILTIWKILVPAYLNGYSPVWIGIGITVFLTAVITFFVFGFDRRTVTASLGALLGIFTTCILGMIFTDLFKINGAVMQDSESLLYSGFQHLNLTAIFMSSIFIGASGAMMDLSVDITSAIHEVVEKKPEIGWKEAARSGMNVGRAAMGTMTATLLLAYSGGYISLLMVFMAQGTPIDHILNYKYVSAEILDTIVGSIGLVTVAPFTALVAGILLTRKNYVKRRILSKVQEADDTETEVSTGVATTEV